jgi:hypothetical protein
MDIAPAALAILPLALNVQKLSFKIYDVRLRWRRNSTMLGVTEIIIIASITSVRCCLTTGMFPK